VQDHRAGAGSSLHAIQETMAIKPYYSIVGGSLLKNENLKGRYN